LGGAIEIGRYLSGLCDSLATSMISENRKLTVHCTAVGSTALATEAESLGLIVIELIINALKHAFPGDREGHIQVDFKGEGTGWRLSVSDDGVGRHTDTSKTPRVGLGTSIVEALARQLNARIEIRDNAPGTEVSIIRAATE